MTKISIDIESIKNSLTDIGYEISDCIERENNGVNWQLKFYNSGAVVNVYDTNTKKNTVVNGKCDEEERKKLKEIVDSLKCKEMLVSPLNSRIVSLINRKKEETNYDYKAEWHCSGKDGDLLHDILCLANNTKNEDAYLIVGIKNNGDVIGVAEWRQQNEINDFLSSKKFAGEHVPTIRMHHVYYKYLKVDVLEIKASKNVPFYLAEMYKDVGRQIYTRTGDKNTAKNKQANYVDVECLWRIHFMRENEN